MQRWFVLILSLSVLLAACGSDSGDETTGDTQSDTTAAAPVEDDGDTDTTAAPDDTTTSAPDDDGDSDDDGSDDGATEGTGPSTATVTIGDDTYQFSSEGAVVAQCLPDLFGIMSVQLPMADGGDGGVSIVALHDDTDPAVVEQINTIQVTVGDVDWVADPEDVRIAGNADLEGKSQVDTVEVDGSTVRGTATFVGSSSLFGPDAEMATGTFEATCGEERTS